MFTVDDLGPEKPKPVHCNKWIESTIKDILGENRIPYEAYRDFEELAAEALKQVDYKQAWNMLYDKVFAIFGPYENTTKVRNAMEEIEEALKNGK